MKSAVSTALLTTTAVALLLTLAGALGTDTVMDALKTPADIFSDGALYLRVYVFGLLFLFLYNVCTGIFNAMGDSRTPLVLLILSSVSNVILDPFLSRFSTGASQVSPATFIARGCAGVLAFLLLLRRVHAFDTGGHFLLFSVRYAAPAGGLRHPLDRPAELCLGRQRHHPVLCQPVRRDGHRGLFRRNQGQYVRADLLHVVPPPACQLCGAEHRRAQAGPHPARLRAGACYSIGLALIFTALYMLLANPLVGLFVPAGSASGVIGVGRQFLFIVAPFYGLLCVKFVRQRACAARAPCGCSW